MYALALIAAVGATYGAPSNLSALEALQREFMQDSYDRSMAAYDGRGAARSNFPQDVRLLRCEVVQGDGGASMTSFKGAHLCVFEVVTLGAPDYTTRGIFQHDGLEWTYHGAFGEITVDNYGDLANRPPGGRQVLKPGSIGYDGDPSDPFNAGAVSPYDAIVNGHDWWTP